MLRVFIICFVFILFSCAKKEDWTCSCEVYTSTGNSIENKEIKNMIKTDAQHECERFGEEKSGPGGAHECTLR